jgi:hypothetical protein
MEFRQSILALSVITALTGCGSSSDDKSTEITDPPVVTNPETPSVSEAKINGIASKGTLKNAQLTFYKYEEGNAVELTADELGDSSLVTDENGLYQVTLNDVDGIVKVELSVSGDVDSPTIMVCDAPMGCGFGDDDVVIKFGENVNLTLQDPNFTLTSILSISNESADTQGIANITPLTHMATALAESRGEVSEQTISDAQSEIANTFGLVGALSSLVPGAMETPSSLFNQDNTNAMRYALINAGIAHALYSEEPELSLSAKLNSAVDDMVAANGGMLVSADADDDDLFELSIEDVLKGSEQALSQLIDVIAENPLLVAHLDDLEQIATNIANEIQVKRTKAGADGRIKGNVSDETQGDAIAKASAMVNDIRLFANLFDVTNSSGEDFESEGEQFVNLVETAGDMVAEQGDSFTLLSDVIEAITDIHQQLEQNEITGTVFDLADYLSTAATGSVTIDEENLVFSVNAQSGSETLNLNVAINALEENTQYQLLLSGKAENAVVELIIAEGSHATLSLDTAVTRSQIENGNIEAEPIKGELKLSVNLAQKETALVTNPVSFTGTFNAQLLPLKVYSAEHSNDSWNESAWDYTLDQDMLVLPKIASLSGEFSSLEGAEVKATATVNIKDLESYIPPELSGFGEMYENIAQVTINDADTELTLSINNDETFTRYVYTKTAESSGNWKIAANRATDIEGYFQGTFNREAYSTGERQYYMYNQSNEVNDSKYSWIEFIEYNESDGVYNLMANFDYFSDFNQGVLTKSDGEQVNIGDISYQNNGWFYSLEEAMQMLSIGNPTDPGSISSYYYNVFDSGYSATLKDIGGFRLNTDEVLDKVTAGSSFTVNGYLVSPFLNDKLALTVSENGTNLEAVVEGGTTQAIKVDRADDNSFSVNNDVIGNDGRFEERQTLKVTSTDITLDENVSVEYFQQYDDWSWGSAVILTPIDSTNNSQIDMFVCKSIDFTKINVAGEYLSFDGSVINVEEQSVDCGSYSTVGDFIDESWIFTYFDITSQSLNNFTADKIFISSFSGYRNEAPVPKVPGEEPFEQFQARTYYSYVDGFGRVAADFTQPEHMQWSADGTYKIDMYLAQPELGTNLESEETFLDVNAALNVQVKVGEYNLELSLMGERTELEQGQLSLDVKYLLPESDKQRRFSVSYDTKLETLSATNSENVKLVLVESKDETAEQQVLGTIMVGDEKAAEIVKRDSLVLIVYENGTVETL